MYGAAGLCPTHALERFINRYLCARFFQGRFGAVRFRPQPAIQSRVLPARVARRRRKLRCLNNCKEEEGLLVKDHWLEYKAKGLSLKHAKPDGMILDPNSAPSALMTRPTTGKDIPHMRFY